MHRHRKQKNVTRGFSDRIIIDESDDLIFQKAMQRYNVGLFQEAENLISCYLKSHPRDDAAWNLSGLIAKQFRKNDTAIELFNTAIQIHNQEYAYHNNLGVALRDSGKLEDAILCFQKALELNPNSHNAAYNLGKTHHIRREFSLALEWYDFAINQAPNLIQVYNAKACVYRDQGMIEKAIEIHQNTIEKNLSNTLFYSNLLLYLHYLEDMDPEIMFGYHKEWAQRYASKEIRSDDNYSNTAVPTRRLRIGYVSADFRFHSVAFFVNPIFCCHDRQKYEIYCYADLVSPDEVTQMMISNVEHWRSIYDMSDDQVYHVIQEDCIDILVDLNGHTGKNRMQLFSRKPAPIQVTYLGYPNTTGMHAMDYRITDAVADPPGITDQYHTEKLLRLPGGFLCYQMIKRYPKTTHPPCMKNGFVTFGSFNNRLKINSKVITAWSDLLLRVPSSRLILKSSLVQDGESNQSLLSEFVERGIDASRIEIMPYMLFHDHIKQYQRIDIALDTFPYNGTTTTCDALWMGVPVVTLAGRTHVSRVGASILCQLGLDEWVVSSLDDYVKKAAMLAGDITNLKFLRRTLRKRLEISPMMDKENFSLKLESAYRRMWSDRCASLISNELEGKKDIMTAEMPGDIKVCVPNDVNCIASYIFQEKNDWFEQEISFIREILEPGMDIVDIGSGYGVYALTAANCVGPSGRVWAFEPSQLTSAYLGRSIKSNQLSNVTIHHSGIADTARAGFLDLNVSPDFDRSIDFEFSDIKEAVSMMHLDAWVQSTDTEIDFLRMDPLGQEDNILCGGKHFFERFSPLILYKIKNGILLHPEMISAFLNIGYQSYRLVPGLKILVPISIDERLDAFQINLFCCKSDRAEALQRQGVLIGNEENELPLVDILSPLWIDYLQTTPYLLRFISLWEAFCTDHATDPDWQTHQQALSAYAVSRSTEYSMPYRYAALVSSYELMTDLLKNQPKVSRILSVIRIANDLGYRENALYWLNHLYHFFESSHDFSLDEPFLAVSERMEGLDPGNEIGQWLIYGVLETRELCQAYSSYFTGKKSLPELEMMLTSPFCSDEMERRYRLIIERFGTEPEGRGQRTEN